MEIKKYPLTDSCYIIVFEGRTNTKYSSNPKDSYLVFNNKFIVTEASNFSTFNFSMLGKLKEVKDSSIEKFLKDNEIEFGINGRLFLENFLTSLGWEINDNTWVLIPKPSKKLSGKKIPIEFNIAKEDFSYTYQDVLLDVYMTNITTKSKSVKFSVKIPKFIYDQCMLDPNIDKRPIDNYIESESLSNLHSTLQNLSSQAIALVKRDIEAKKAKKVICINFTSSEISKKDSYQFGYLGQKIGVSFNFYICYYTGNEYYTYKTIEGFSSIKTHNGNRGIVDYELDGRKFWIKEVPNVMVEWSQEKEDYLVNLENKFGDLSKNLNSFLKDLNDEKLLDLIENNNLLKLT